MGGGLVLETLLTGMLDRVLYFGVIRSFYIHVGYDKVVIRYEASWFELGPFPSSFRRVQTRLEVLGSSLSVH